MAETQIKVKDKSVRGKRAKLFVLFTFLVFLGILLVCGRYFYTELFVPSVTFDTVFDVSKGRSFKEVLASLEEEGLIPSAYALTLYAKVFDDNSPIKAGSFLLRAGQRPIDVLYSLKHDQTILERVTIPEGFTAKQIQGRLQAELPEIPSLLQLIDNSKFPENIKAEFRKNPPTSPEGYLYPDTYFFSKGRAEDVYKVMYRQMVKVLEDLYNLYPENPVAKGVLTLHEAVILASVVEKEAMLDYERPLIAGVFLRRLSRGMYLQSCATVTYVLDKPVARLTYKDLEIDSLYNTYRYPGLPVGPIGNPGLKSLTAVFNPEISEYLFFVARGDGSHVFTRTYQEHLKAQTIHEDWLKQNSKE